MPSNPRAEGTALLAATARSDADREHGVDAADSTLGQPQQSRAPQPSSPAPDTHRRPPGPSTTLKSFCTPSSWSPGARTARTPGQERTRRAKVRTPRRKSHQGCASHARGGGKRHAHQTVASPLARLKYRRNSSNDSRETAQRSHGANDGQFGHTWERHHTILSVQRRLCVFWVL